MPHREIKGSVDLAAFVRDFEVQTLREGSAVIKMLVAFLAHDQRSALVECVVVEGHLRQGFFVLLGQRNEVTVGRVHPRSSPEKSPGVKRCIAWVTEQLHRSNPGSEFGNTNLEEVYRAPFEAAGDEDQQER